MLMEFFRDETGAQSTEYALIAAVVSVVMIGGLLLVGSRMSTAFEYVQTSTASTLP